jgi:hypothetical protein
VLRVNASPPDVSYHGDAELRRLPLDNYIITNDGAEFTIDKRLGDPTTN